MIYNDDFEQDFFNLLRYINEYTKQLGVSLAQVDTRELLSVCVEMRQEFPHVDGMAKASAFKKVANFVAHFLHYKPIKTKFCVTGCQGGDDINAVVAFDVAIMCLENSSIEIEPDVFQPIDKKLYISDHSYKDIIEALTNPSISPETHYHLLSVFFEQIVYKTNNGLEYRPPTKGAGYYPGPYSVTDGDDMMGL